MMSSEAEVALCRMSEKIINKVKTAYKFKSDVVVRIGGWSGVARTTVLRRTVRMLAEEANFNSTTDLRIVHVDVSKGAEAYVVGQQIRRKQAAAAALGLEDFPDAESPFWEQGAPGSGLTSLYYLVIVNLVDDSLHHISLAGLSPHPFARSAILVPALSVALATPRNEATQLAPVDEDVLIDLFRYRSTRTYHRLRPAPAPRWDIKEGPSFREKVVQHHFDDLSVEAALGLLRLEARDAGNKVARRRCPEGCGNNKNGGSGSGSGSQWYRGRRLPIINEDTVLRCFLYCAIVQDVCNPVHTWRAEGLLGDDGFDHAPEAAEPVCDLIAELVDRCMVDKNSAADGKVRVCAPLMGRAQSAASSAMMSSKEPRRSRTIVFHTAGSQSPHSQVRQQDDRKSASAVEGYWTTLINALQANERVPAAPLVRLRDLYPNLRTLVLKDNDRLHEIPDEVFSPDMPSMRVLDLSGTPIQKLPSSLPCCRNLRMLSLNHCTRLESLHPTVEEGGLAHLEVLSVMGSGLPGMTKLSLRRRTHHLKALCFAGAFGRLEELHLYVNNGRVFEEYFTPGRGQWPVGRIRRAQISVWHGDNNNNNGNPEKKIETTGAHIQEKFPPYAHVYRQMEPRVLHPHLYDVGGTCCRHLEIHGGEEDVLVYNLARKVCQPDFISISDSQAETQIDLDVFVGLTDCRIRRCHKIRTALFGNPKSSTKYALKNVYLASLQQLRYMCSFSAVGSLAHLTNIHIEYCQNLVALFSGSSPQLPVLEELEVRFCTRLQSIFSREIDREVVNGQSHLPSLKKLHLCQLPQLASICSGNMQSIKKLKVRGCWKLHNLPLRTAATLPIADMVEVDGETKWWNNVVSKDGFDKEKVKFKGR
ncbi:hypothetical protein Taro_041719 [Colocasia esculenta]|uniref:Disease resistance protein At4g27190-like leucine-rich repeats domain-containing protein n=1 Tax=Colocasia esculenta TaxID=4460 RepID=A0A843WY20_COLES|nr:hypothetical protein [Colocasia esculenta]